MRLSSHLDPLMPPDFTIKDPSFGRASTFAQKMKTQSSGNPVPERASLNFPPLLTFIAGLLILLSTAIWKKKGH